ncbi:MAG: hypothetical protein QOJ76_984, partial [Acidobacteriota bacterium]|nr:hypothetical protein [Acidobacteriota bacterium]
MRTPRIIFNTSRAPRIVNIFLLLLLLPGVRGASLARQEPVVVTDSPPPKAQTAPTPRPPAPAAQPASNLPTQPTSSLPTQGAADVDASKAPGGKDASRAPRAPAAPIKGRIVGDAGEPLAGVAVYAMPRVVNSIFRSPHVVTADDDGNFEVRGLDPGLYMLNASLPGYVSEVDPLTGRPGGAYRPGDNATIRLVRGGVVTGSVTDSQGEPLVALNVRAFRVRDLDGHTPQTPFPFSAEDRTDDRGVYRIYGLLPGFYYVLVGGFSPSAFGPGTAYGNDAPTFYPSGTRDTAVEVAVRAGQETAGVDVRYREEQGHRVTGTVEIPPGAPSEFGAGVLLTFASTGMVAASSGVNSTTSERSFSIEGVADGDYDLQALGGAREGLSIASAPQRVSVRGTDVTGLRVTLMSLASAAGTIVIEPATEAERALDACKSVRAAQLPQETLISVTPDRAASPVQLISRLSSPHDATPDESGDFTLRSLEPGRYHFSFRLFDDALYVRALQLPGSSSSNAASLSNAAAATPASPRTANPSSQRTADSAPQRTANQRNANPTTTRTTNPTTTTHATPAAVASSNAAASARGLLELKAGQQLSGLIVRLAEGAASFGGRVVPAEGNAPPPAFAQLRVHLIPQERERADDPLRFYET